MGLGIAFAATRALIAFVSRGNAYVDLSPTPNSGVLLFTLGISLLTGILFGLAPSIHAARIGTHGTLSAGSRTSASAGGKTARFWPKALVTFQVMLSLVLLVVAGLFLGPCEIFRNRTTVSSECICCSPMWASISPDIHLTRCQRFTRPFWNASAIPGVRSAALAATPPISGGSWSSNISLSGYILAPKKTWCPF